MIADRPAGLAEDQLNFKTFAKALGNLIDNPKTETPLTVAIHAPWGTGKSSLGHMIKEHLESKPAAGGIEPHTTYWFDAWLHDDARNLTAAFLADLVRYLDGSRSLWRRRLFPISTEFLSHKEILRRRIFVFVTAALVALGFYWFAPDLLPKLFPADEKTTAKAAGSAGLVGLLVALAGYIPRVLEAGKKIGEFVLNPAVAANQGSLSQTREQLKDLIEEVVPAPSRLVVFVDDVERCRSTSGVDLLESINQLLPMRNPGVVVVVMTDVEALSLIAASKYPSLAKRCASESQFGREYLQKIIQIQFSLPAESRESVRQYSDSLVRDAAEDDAAKEMPKLGIGARLAAVLRRLSPVDVAWSGLGFRDFWARWRGATWRPLRWLGGFFGLAQAPAFFALQWAVEQGYPRRGAAAFRSPPAVWPTAAYFGLAFAGLALLYASLGMAYAKSLPVTMFLLTTTVHVGVMSFFTLAWTTVFWTVLWFAVTAVLLLFFVLAHASGARQSDAKRIVNLRNAVKRADAPPPVDSPIAAVLAEEHAALSLGNDSDVFRDARAVAFRHLHPRPRVMKHIVNQLRLLISIMHGRKLLGSPGGPTPQQIGKWVALAVKWPDIAIHVAGNTEAMRAMEAAAGEKAPKFDFLGPRCTPSSDGEATELAELLRTEPKLAGVVDQFVYLRSPAAEAEIGTGETSPPPA